MNAALLWMKAAVVAGALALPSLAWACPYCAQREGLSDTATVFLFASMIFAPFVVAGVAIRVIRRLDADAPNGARKDASLRSDPS
jgi:hypothetical protein